MAFPTSPPWKHFRHDNLHYDHLYTLLIGLGGREGRNNILDAAHERGECTNIAHTSLDPRHHLERVCWQQQLARRCSCKAAFRHAAGMSSLIEILHPLLGGHQHCIEGVLAHVGQLGERLHGRPQQVHRHALHPVDDLLCHAEDLVDVGNVLLAVLGAFVRQPV